MSTDDTLFAPERRREKEAREALLLQIRVMERFYREQWDRAIRMLNQAEAMRNGRHV